MAIPDMDAIVQAAMNGEAPVAEVTKRDGSDKRASMPGLGAVSKRVAALQAKEEAVRARLRLLSDKPVPVTATDVFELMRGRAVRSSTQRAFRSMDADGNGVLDAEEIRSALRRLKLDLPPDQARALVAAIDVNGDGLVQWDEWVAFVNDRHRETLAQEAVSASAGDPSSRRHNPPPPGATATGNRRGLVRAAEATSLLRSIVKKAPHMVEALPLTVSECRALVRRLDTGATSFVRVADIERYLLAEAARRTKPGVATVVDGAATLSARAGAIGVAREGAAPAAAEATDFAVPEHVREAARGVASLCDTNGDGWVQVDDVAEVARALSRHTVLGRTSAEGGSQARFVSSARASMESGLTEDAGAARVAAAEERIARLRARKERAFGHVLETYRRQNEAEQRRYEARSARARDLRIAQTARDDGRRQAALARETRVGKRAVFGNGVSPALDSGFTVAPVLVESKHEEGKLGWRA
ncbi:hypothetical protein FNF29_01615 [Cafeteria roenbergensis]|uniref:EF-hand domain-containing protein n=1 Tax=Cafeteria roenbergensis TaxID=33653 RepID=A0A5A8CU43_CAFRO|nr:hypothetical protein FNF29_01615 [Cafeteria roenbergensis]|eukprot:KAA0155700.1 hypothetical protein FNF29_01615 [Cafeteria roenbergensis]